MFRSHRPVCNGCRTRGHFKKNCSRAEEQKVVAEAEGKENVAAKESVATSSTAEVELVEMEAANSKLLHFWGSINEERNVCLRRLRRKKLLKLHTSE